MYIFITKYVSCHDTMFYIIYKLGPYVMEKIDFDIYETPHDKRTKQSYHVRITNSELLDFEKVKKELPISRRQHLATFLW
jgi:hypothetical protein